MFGFDEIQLNSAVSPGLTVIVSGRTVSSIVSLGCSNSGPEVEIMTSKKLLTDFYLWTVIN